MATVQDLYDQITSQLSPEEALMNMLKASVQQYEDQKLDAQGQPVHPIYIIVLAAKELGWEIAMNTEEQNPNVIGLTMGTKEYMFFAQ